MSGGKWLELRRQVRHVGVLGVPQFEDIPDWMKKNVQRFWQTLAETARPLVYLWVELEKALGTANQDVSKDTQYYAI